MFNADKRSLKKAVEKLDRADENFLVKYTCEHEGCGKDFEFSITKEAFEQKNQRNRQYSAHCKTCAQKFILSEQRYKKWQTLIEGVEL
jgi:hypothetical protein